MAVSTLPPVPSLFVRRAGPLMRCLQLGSIAIGVVGVTIVCGLPSFRIFGWQELAWFAVAVMGLNVLTGYSGQISLGHIAFFAIGAYATALLMADAGWPFPFALLAAAALSWCSGLVFGLPAVRIRGFQLAMLTLGLAVVIPILIKRYESITHGTVGVSVPRPQPPSWTHLGEEPWIFLIEVMVAIIVFVLVRNLMRGRAGRSITAVRDDELVAAAMGIDVVRVKAIAFAWSAMCTGVGGGLYALVRGYVAADAMRVSVGLSFLSAMVVGGAGRISGPAYGAIFGGFLAVQAARISPEFSLALYAAGIIVFMFVAPGGVAGLINRLRRRLVTVTD